MMPPRMLVLLPMMTIWILLLSGAGVCIDWFIGRLIGLVLIR
jgi:hypothetical protein